MDETNVIIILLKDRSDDNVNFAVQTMVLQKKKGNNTVSEIIMASLFI
jgi:hypothetical protein